MDTNSKLEFPALVIDGSGSDVFAGVLGEDGQWITHTCQSGAPLEQLFTTVEATLEAAQIELQSIRSYIYCEGPGSVLGLRLCAMAIETWSRLYPESANYWSYNTLQLCAKQLCQQATLDKQALLVSDWKKGAWNAIKIDDGQFGETTVVDDSEIAEHSGAVFHLPQRKGWQKPPPNAQTIPYSPERLPELLVQSNWLKPTPGVELYSSGINTFAKWTPDRHRAATPKT